MLGQFLSENVKVSRILSSVAAGTSDQTSSAIDMAGFDGCLIIAAVGALTATQVTEMKLQQSSDDGSADAYSDIEGSKTTAGWVFDPSGLCAQGLQFRQERRDGSRAVCRAAW